MTEELKKIRSSVSLVLSESVLEDPDLGSQGPLFSDQHVVATGFNFDASNVRDLLDSVMEKHDRYDTKIPLHVSNCTDCFLSLARLPPMAGCGCGWLATLLLILFAIAGSRSLASTLQHVFLQTR